MKKKGSRETRPKKLVKILITMFSIMCLLPLFTVGSFQIVRNFEAKQEIIAGEQNSLAMNAAFEVGRFIEEKFHTLNAFARICIPALQTEKDRYLFLEKIISCHFEFREAAILDSTGQEISKISRLSLVKPEDLADWSDNELFHTVSQSQRFISTVHIDKVTSEPLITLAIPVNNILGNFEYALLAEVNLKFMWDLVDSLKVGKNGLAYVVDNRGTLIAFSDISRVLRGENISALPAVSRFINKENNPQSIQITTGITGSSVLTSHVPLKQPEWAVVVELPVLEAYGPLISKLGLSAGSIILVAILAVIVGIFLSRRITRPIINLIDTAQKIGEGNLDIIIETDTTDEIGQLASAFNTMTENLKRSTTSIDNLNREIAERKQEEKERKRLEAQLAYAEKMQAIGTLAGGIAHNFNNLLMGIQGNISLMLFNKDPEDAEYKKLDSIQKLVQSGAKLTGQLIGYAREGRYQVKPLNLNKLVMETLETFASTRKDIKVHIDLSRELYEINADKSQIEQSLLNLYANSAEAMAGGGEIFASTSNVSHSAMKNKPYDPKPGHYVHLTIRDTGIGMDQQTRDRIFEPFFTTKGMAKGSGLGLASVYGIVKGHGGYIDVDSETGAGTTVEIYLPAAKTIKEDTEGDRAKASQGKGTILLVDDESFILEATGQMLEILGFKVLYAGSGKDALDIYARESERIDMILLDMIMPDMSGGKTYDFIKEINPDAKVLLSSGYSLDSEAKEIMKRGCRAFIQKPYNLKELYQKITGILG